MEVIINGKGFVNISTLYVARGVLHVMSRTGDLQEFKLCDIRTLCVYDTIESESPCAESHSVSG